MKCKNSKNILSNNKILLDTSKLLSGTLLAQLFTVLSAPFLTRFYSPDDFGIYAVFVSCTSIISLVSCLRYELAVITSENDEESLNLLAVSLISLICVSGLSFISLSLFQEIIAKKINVPTSYLWLFPVGIFFQGLFLALRSWSTRTKDFTTLSIVQVLQSFLSTSIQLGSCYIGFVSPISLILGVVLSFVCSCSILAYVFVKKYYAFFVDSVTDRKIFLVTKKYKNFPIYNVWSSLLNNISWQLPIFLLLTFFSSTVVGYYSLSLRLVQVPISLISSSFATIFFQRSSEIKDPIELKRWVFKNFQFFIKIAIFPTIFIAFFGEEIFVFIFGANWSQSGFFLQILSPWIFIWFIASNLSTILLVLKKQKLCLIVDCLIFITRFLSLWIGGIFQSEYIALSLFSFSGFFVYGYYAFMSLFSAGISIREIMTTLFSEMNLLTTLPILALLTIKTFEVGIMIKVFYVSIVTVTYYLVFFLKDIKNINFIDDFSTK